MRFLLPTINFHLRRKRFAFAVAPRWKGASIDAAEAPLRSANPDKAKACCFSSTILASSVGEHLPCASIQLLRSRPDSSDTALRHPAQPSSGRKQVGVEGLRVLAHASCEMLQRRSGQKAMDFQISPLVR